MWYADSLKPIFVLIAILNGFNNDKNLQTWKLYGKKTSQKPTLALPMFIHKTKCLWRPSHAKESCSPSRRSTRVYILERVLLNCVLYSALLALTNVIFCSLSCRELAKEFPSKPLFSIFSSTASTADLSATLSDSCKLNYRYFPGC